jgi:hypothetical protein
MAQKSKTFNQKNSKNGNQPQKKIKDDFKKKIQKLD